MPKSFRIAALSTSRAESRSARAAARRSPARRPATAAMEVLENRQLMSAVVEAAAHAVAPQPASQVRSATPRVAVQSTPNEVTPHTQGVPQLSSRPGAAYTIYLNVAGFHYDGTWFARSGDTYTPGFTPALNDRSPTDTFNATEQAQIRTIWSTVAQSYAPLDVNVTTVDPYNAVNDPTPTDGERQDYYDATPNLMHTVIGSQVRPAGTPNTTPNNKWFSDGADGVSPGIGIVAGRTSGAVEAGEHTNWMFTEAQAGAATGGVINGLYIGGITAHENAHSFGLYHQGDYRLDGGEVVQVAEYSTGDDGTGPTDPGTYVPTIGDANNKQRIAWRDGFVNNGSFVRQNDLKVMLATNTAAQATANGRTGGVDLHFVDDGIGNSIATATPLPLTGTSVNPALANGVIVPKSESNPVASGASNYTTDFFSFYTDGSPISLSVYDSTQFLATGVADGAGTLNSTLKILRADGTTAGTSTQSASTLVETFNGTLPAGTYYAAIGSNGGHAQVNAADYIPATYFDTGAFFLKGTGFKVAPATGKPVVTSNPTSKTVAAGSSVSFTAAATGTPAPTVQWQVSTNAGGTYTDLAGKTSTTLTFTAAAGQSGYRYRAVFTNSKGAATTTAATLTVGTAAPNLTRLVLVDADADADVKTLANNGTIRWEDLPTLNLSVRADPASTAVKSVKFALDGKPVRTENGAPYSLFGDVSGDFNPGAIPTGTHTLVATPYSGTNGSGTAGAPLTVKFTYAGRAKVTRLVLVNAETDQDIMTLNPGATLNLSTLPPKLNVRAVTSGGVVGSMRFSLDGGFTRTENNAPFSLFGDVSGDYVWGTFATGARTLTVTPYSRDGAAGLVGGALQVKFTVTAPSAARSAAKPAGFTGWSALGEAPTDLLDRHVVDGLYKLDADDAAAILKS